MLRKRSRTVTSNKQTLVSDHSSNNNTNINPSSSEKSQKPTSFLFNSPRIFKDFFMSKDSSSTLMSPSSVLESKPLFSSVFPTCPPHQWLDPQNLPSAKHSWEHPGIGLALIDHDHDDDDDDDEWVPMNKPCKEKRSKLVVFGSQLKIQIPPLPLPNQPPQTPLFPPPPTSPPQSPMEFGIKTPKSNLFGHLFVNSFQPEKRSLSVKDMELSEDYTCVISHGPNPKTTHIFGNCIVEAAENSYTRIRDSPPSEELDFLSFCHHCNKKIGQGKDIYMYRGERAFCSQECRGQEMLFDGIES